MASRRLFGAAAFVTTAALAAQSSTPLPHPPGYVCVRTNGPIAVDGVLDDAAWRAAPWTDPFGEMASGVVPEAALHTRVKMLWDDRFLYIAADIAGPHLWAEMTRHDAPLYQENAFEFFVDPDGDNHEYDELEINARNTTWDLFLPRPYRDGGQGLSDWEILGLRSAVHLDGTLNDPSDVDRGWTVEIAIPWFALGEQAHRPVPPRAGDQWRMNFTRVETPLRIENGGYRKIDGQPSRVFAWARQYVADIHRPETWGYVQFETGPKPFVPDSSWPARRWLISVYEAQRAYQRAHQRYASSLDELAMAPPRPWSARTGATLDRWESCVLVSSEEWCIREDSRVWRKK